MGNWRPEELERKLKGNPDLKIEQARNKAIVTGHGGTSKYHAQRTEYGGRIFASKREARYAEQLDLRVKAGEVSYWLPQVPIPIPGHATYRVDFLEVWGDGSLHWVEVKGVRTPMYKLKKKQVEERYPIKIEEY